MALFKAGKKLLDIVDKGVNIADKAVADKTKVIELQNTLQKVRAQLMLSGKGESITKITICGLVSLVVGVLSWTFIFHPDNMQMAINYSVAVTPLIAMLTGAYTTGTTLSRKWKNGG